MLNIQCDSIASTNSSTANNSCEFRYVLYVYISAIFAISTMQPLLLVYNDNEKQNVNAIYFIDSDFWSFTFITYTCENANVKM